MRMIQVTLAIAFSVSACSSKENDAASEGSDTAKVVLFGKEFRVEARHLFGEQKSLRTSCPLWDLYLTSSEISPCTLYQYQDETAATEDQHILRAGDGTELKGTVTASDKLGDQQLSIDGKNYYCKTSGSAIYDQNGKVLDRDYLKTFLLTSQDADAWEDLDASKVLTIGFTQQAVCNGIYGG